MNNVGTKNEVNEVPEFGIQQSITHPLISRERFADLTGLPLGVVVGFINKGYLPTYSIGKYSLVNIELLRKRCLETERS
jgi:hypothetical protein